MVVLALLLLVVVAAVVVFVLVTGTTGTVELTWEQLNLSFAPSPLVLFLLGAATLLLAVVALGMLRSGSRRGMAKRRELKRLRKIEKEQGTTPDGSRAGTPAAAPVPAGAHDRGAHAAPPQPASHTAPLPTTAPPPSQPASQPQAAPPVDVRADTSSTEPPKRL